MEHWPRNRQREEHRAPFLILQNAPYRMHLPGILQHQPVTIRKNNQANMKRCGKIDPKEKRRITDKNTCKSK